MGMAARRIDAEDRDLTQFNMRMPRGLLRELDEWVDELNRGRGLGKINRSDLIREVLYWACFARPNVERAAIPVHDPESSNRAKAIVAARGLGMSESAIALVMHATPPEPDHPVDEWLRRIKLQDE